MKRILTAAVIVPLALAAVLLLSGWWFLLLAIVVVELAAVEFAVIGSRLGGRRVMWVLPVLVPAAVLLLLPDWLPSPLPTTAHLLLLGVLVSSVVASVALFSRQTLDETLVAIGLLSFGVPYFAVPIAALARLQAADEWLVVLVLAIVSLGDTAAYYVGTHLGRHRLAPTVSPKKTWEGAGASLVTATAAAAVWSTLRLGEIDSGLLAVAVATSIVAQIGDLVESMLKRRVGVKDSSSLLPGHGGVLDRLDALLFALPALSVGLWLLGWNL
ncbi:MAG: phosphatidate cytidylyltransferase [Acidobacteriota bacterium]|nr:phosphatidate cytidylyltransferase [Acidobacteriota bacterium]